MGLFSGKETDEQVVKRLAKKARSIVAMLKGAFKGPNGTDMKFPLLYAAGLAGYACHQAVKAEHGTFAVAETKNGKHFYFGDDVNRYLLENPCSVWSFCQAVTHLDQEKIIGIVVNTVQTVGTDRLQIWNMTPDSVYPHIKSCWDGIYPNMTEKFCRKPSEWPILYGIVLQNIILQSIEAGASPEEAGLMAMECAVVISRMDDDSI